MITQANLSSLGSLQISADARARITTAVEQGCVVLVPSQDATVSGTQAIAWMELGPATGQFSEVLEDGTRSADVEYAGVEDFNPFIWDELAEEGLAGVPPPPPPPPPNPAALALKSNLAANLATGTSVAGLLAYWVQQTVNTQTKGPDPLAYQLNLLGSWMAGS